MKWKKITNHNHLSFWTMRSGYLVSRSEFLEHHPIPFFKNRLNTSVQCDQRWYLRSRGLCTVTDNLSLCIGVSHPIENLALVLVLRMITTNWRALALENSVDLSFEARLAFIVPYLTGRSHCLPNTTSPVQTLPSLQSFCAFLGVSQMLRVSRLEQQGYP